MDGHMELTCAAMFVSLPLYCARFTVMFYT
jgi:hypothetical protein